MCDDETTEDTPVEKRCENCGITFISEFPDEEYCDVCWEVENKDDPSHIRNRWR